jgi:acyl-CoA synthetase (NDP forming)
MGDAPAGLGNGTPGAQPAIHRLLWPDSIAVIGASADTASISGRPVRILRQLGYAGRVYPVNPKYERILDLQVFPSVTAIPAPVDLAIIAVPARMVPEVLLGCAAARVATAVVFSAGFSEVPGGGEEREAELVANARVSGLRFLGPNSEGFINMIGMVPAGFSPTIDPDRGLQSLQAGNIAVVAQSGGVGFGLFNEGLSRGLGFSYVVSTGNEADLESLDFLEYFLQDEGTRVVLMFVEGFKRARRFPELAARAARLGKPLVVAKVGRSAAGRQASASHTAHLAGRDTAYDAVFRRWGVWRAVDQEDAVDKALAFARAPLPRGKRTAIVTFSGGAGVWMADAVEEAGLETPVLSDHLQEKLRELIPSYGSPANPVDVTAQVVDTAGGVVPVLETVLGSDEVDMLVLITTLASVEALTREEERLRRLITVSDKPILVYGYTHPSPESVEVLSRLGLAWFPSSTRTARAARQLYDYGAFLHRRQGGQLGPELVSPQRVKGPLAEGTLVEFRAKKLLRGWGLPTPRGTLVTTPDEAAEAARALKAPVAVKVQSASLVHKTDVGGVALGLETPEAVREAAQRVLAQVHEARPDAFVEGLLVEEMAKPGGEMILGALDDPDFGPLVMVGVGGADAELLADTAFAPSPLNEDEALELITSLRGVGLISGREGREDADIHALADALAKLSQLAAAHAGAFVAIDLNPVVVHRAGRGVTVVDAVFEGRDP